MGVNIAFLSYLDDKGVFAKGRRILDMGAQNLNCATMEVVRAFVAKHNNAMDSNELTRFAQAIAEARPRPGTGNAGEAFLAEVLEKAGMDYLSIDVFDRPRNLILDLNFEELPAHLKGTFDVCLNFGTSEHIFNQINVFKVIHDSIHPDGTIFHQVPSIGYVDHGYFIYTPMFFVDLANANDYDILDIWVGVDSNSRFYDAIKYERQRMLNPSLPRNKWDHNATIQNSTINVLLRKTQAADFKIPLEVSTAVAKVRPEIQQKYDGPTDVSAKVKGGPGVVSGALRMASGWALQKELMYRILRKIGLRR